MWLQLTHVTGKNNTNSSHGICSLGYYYNKRYFFKLNQPRKVLSFLSEHFKNSGKKSDILKQNNFIPSPMRSVQFCLLNIELVQLWSPTFVFGWIWPLKNEVPQHHVSQLKKTKMEGQFHFLKLQGPNINFLNLKDLNQTYLKFIRQNRIIYHL